MHKLKHTGNEKKQVSSRDSIPWILKRTGVKNREELYNAFCTHYALVESPGNSPKKQEAANLLARALNSVPPEQKEEILENAGDELSDLKSRASQKRHRIIELPAISAALIIADWDWVVAKILPIANVIGLHVTTGHSSLSRGMAIGIGMALLAVAWISDISGIFSAPARRLESFISAVRHNMAGEEKSG
jgi:hypothetical protein